MSETSGPVSDGDLMVGAYVGFLNWAVAEPDMLAQFKEETGLSFPASPRSGLEAMIDAACKVDETTDMTMLKFIVWVTECHWGVEYAPTFYTELKKRAS